jgi:hypothetical protein
VQVFSEIDNFILELDHALVIEFLVFQSHLFLHQQNCIDILILLVVLLEFLCQTLSLYDEFVNGIDIGAEFVHSSQCGLIDLQVLL